jgi:hypothetical protein
MVSVNGFTARTLGDIRWMVSAITFQLTAYFRDGIVVICVGREVAASGHTACYQSGSSADRDEKSQKPSHSTARCGYPLAESEYNARKNRLATCVLSYHPWNLFELVPLSLQSQA